MFNVIRLHRDLAIWTGQRIIRRFWMVTNSNPELPDTATVSVDVAARYLGISRSLAFEAVGRGELKAIRVGRRWLVSTAYLRQLVAA